MEKRPIYMLRDRGMIAVTGEDARGWLDNLVTNDLSDLEVKGIVYAGLLSPHGKLQFEFFVHFEAGNALYIETLLDSVPALMKRLQMYKLRSKVTLKDVSEEWCVLWGRVGAEPLAPLQLPDPRAPDKLWRGVCPKAAVGYDQAPGPYVEERVRLGLAEAPLDYELGDVYPHEANMDLTAGVSFTKGCFIGQEVVSRMQNKTVVRKRVVRVRSDEPLAHGADINIGDAVIGRVGSAAGREALAMVRLDRASEALEKGITVMSNGHDVLVDRGALERYRQSVKDRPVVDL